MIKEMKTKTKTVWLTTSELYTISNSVREITHFCPYCNNEITYPLSNGEVLDITTVFIEIGCQFCNEIYNMSWEGEDDFYREEDDDYLPF